MKPNLVIRNSIKSCALLCVLLVPVSLHAQSRIEGQVINGTTGQPAAKQELRLLQPRGGMQQVATAQRTRKGASSFLTSRTGPEHSTLSLPHTREWTITSRPSSIPQ